MDSDTSFEPISEIGVTRDNLDENHSRLLQQKRKVEKEEEDQERLVTRDLRYVKNNRASKRVRLSQHRKKRRFLWNSTKAPNRQVVISSNSSVLASGSVDGTCTSATSLSPVENIIDEGPNEFQQSDQNERLSELEDTSLPSESSLIINSSFSSPYTDISAQSSLASTSLDYGSSKALTSSAASFLLSSSVSLSSAELSPPPPPAATRAASTPTPITSSSILISSPAAALSSFGPASPTLVSSMPSLLSDAELSTSSSLAVLTEPVSPASLPSSSKPFCDNMWDKIKGRRINETYYIFEQIWAISGHSPAFGCNTDHLYLNKEIREGLACKWFFTCRVCGLKFVIYSDKSIDPKYSEKTLDNMPVSIAAVTGVIASGNGQTVLDKILSAMEIPTMSTSTYTRISANVNKKFMEAAEIEMKKAGEEEAKLARFYGDVAPDGVPNIKVTADGCWSKRSFGSNYAALGGVAGIVGVRTQKILYCGVKNKYCYKCSVAANKQQAGSSNIEEMKEHACFKNYSGSSTSMEQAAIVEGFKASMQMHGVRYSHLIADGDSSVYKKILEADPYGAQCKVTKVSCKNHILRCLRRNLEKYCTSTSDRFQPLVEAKRLIRRKIMRLSNAVDAACKYRSVEKNRNAIALLRKDIINAPDHIFGQHKNCDEYFCSNTKAEKEPNLVPALKQTEAYEKLNELMLRVANNSDSLILNENNNKIESFNAVICKLIDGKRVNYNGSSGYHGRSALAVLAFNKEQPMKIMHKIECDNKSPSVDAVSMKNEIRGLKRRDRCYEAKKNVKRKIFNKSDEDYGINEKPDMEAEIYSQKVDEFMQGLNLSEEEKVRLEEATRGQSGNCQWKLERQKRITASNFGPICKMGSKTNTANIVRTIVASTFHGNSATDYGNVMEPKAREQLQLESNETVEECGLIIHSEYPFLGASPDGLIGTDRLVEIKCPTVLFDKSEQEAEEIILNGGIKCLDRLGNLKRNHNYFYQVQGQLEVADRDSALFVLYGPSYIRILEIERDRTFWCTKMLPRLISFFYNCLLPELVDSRLDRQRCIRAVNFAGAPVIPKKKAVAVEETS